MAISNITAAIERRYATLLGERTQLQDEIARTRALMQRVPEMEARIAALEPLLKSATTLLRDLNPDWQPSAVPKKKPLKNDSPFPFGTCSRRALAALRKAAAPMTINEVARTILADVGIMKPDTRLIIQTTSTITSAFKSYEGKTVECCGRNPGQWRAIGKSFDFSD